MKEITVSEATKELIAEARERVPYGRGDLLARLADALEAATRVPVQGEPNDDREAAAAEAERIISNEMQAEAITGALPFKVGFVEGAGWAKSRTAVPTGGDREAVANHLREIGAVGTMGAPCECDSCQKSAERDAATEDRDYWHGVATKAKDQRDAALAAVERVRAEVAHWWSSYSHKRDEVLAALDGTPEPEMEYRWIKESPHPLGMTQVAHVYHRHEYDEYVERHGGRVERRRKAGPWEVCER